MKLIAGLGNPGSKYTNTKHNIGFRITNKLASKYNSKLKKKFFKKANQARISIAGEDILILQPLTYMNLSGGCILGFQKKLGLDLTDLLVVCDDVNLPIGKIRIRPVGSPGGHNGLVSIVDSLGSEEFPRLRIGIKADRPAEDLSKYVLSGFNREQAEAIEGVIDKAVSACESWIDNGIEPTMNKYN